MDIIFQLPFYLENKVLFTFSSFQFMFSYLAVIVLFGVILYKTELIIPKGYMLLWIALFLINFFGLFAGTSTVKEFLKQMSGIMIFSVIFPLFISFKKYDIIHVIRLYIQSSYVLSIIGICQLIISIIFPSLHLPIFTIEYPDPIYWKINRINSLFKEPAHFALFLSPAIFAAFDTFINRKNVIISLKQAIVVFCAFVLTFSSSGYLLFIILPFFFIKGKGYVIMPIFGVLITIIITNSEMFMMRIMDTWNFIKGLSTLDNVNLSTFAFFSNWEVALKNFLTNPILGGGFGAHEKTYFSLYNNSNWIMKLNYNDANSLFLRLMSETGLVGILIFGYFIKKFWIRKTFGNTPYYIINKMCIMIFVLALFRNGHYFNYTFWLFISLYYYSYKFRKFSIPLKYTL